jgi:addiction module HigA family antidote
MMHNPPHPGIIVKKTLIDGANLSITEAAKALGVGRVSLSKIINGRAGISPEMAVRLSIALNTSSKMWLSMQDAYDLWQIEKHKARLSKQISPIGKFNSETLNNSTNYVSY